MDPYSHNIPTSTKLPILDTGKFEQWKFRIQQYLQHEHYALWEVIEFGDSYKSPPDELRKSAAGKGSAKKKGKTVAITAEDMQKRKNDVKARTTLLLALLDEHQLRFNKYDNSKDLWDAILKTFGGNEATKKTKKNQLKQQYDNFKAEGSETLEQTFNRLQAIVSQLEFLDVLIEQDDLNQKFLSSVAPEWLMYSIVWRNRDDLDTMSLDDMYNHLKVYEPEVQKSTGLSSQNMAFVSSSSTSSGKGDVPTASVPTASAQVSTASTDVSAASLSHDTICAYIATQSSGSQIKFEDITQIDDNDIKEMGIKWNLALLSMRVDRFWKKTGKKITIQGSDVAGFDKSKSYRRDPKVEEPAPNVLMAIDGIGWDWSYMDDEEENHALVADDVVPTEFSLMAMSSSISDNEVRDNKIEYLKNELEKVNKEKENINHKLTGFEKSSNNLDSLLGEQRTVKDKTGLGFNEYTTVPPPPAQVYSPPKKDLSWTGLPEFADDTVTDYSRPTPSVDVSKGNSSELEGNHPYVVQRESSGSIMSKSMIKFVKEIGCLNATKINNAKNARKPVVQYAEIYRNTSQSSNVMTNNSSVPIIKDWESETKIPTGGTKVPTGRIKLPTVGSKVPTVKPTVAADLGNKGKAVKASAHWI
ncbi:hypothetical protein Tco_0831362 [Tanacetum coccineum]